MIKTKTAFIYNPYWLTLGGGERYTAGVADFLIKLGWKVDIYWPRNISKSLKNRFNIDLSHANFVSEDWTFSYDLVFWVSDGSLPTSFAKKTLVHFQFPFKLSPRFTLNNFLKSHLYTFVCNSRFTKRFIDQSFRVDSRVIYPPIDTELFPVTKKTNTILYVGRFSGLTQNKNQLQLVKSFQKISPRLSGWKLIVAGGLGIGHDEKLISLLKNAAKNLPIEFVFNPDLKTLKKLYGQAKIFWSASGFGTEEFENPLKVEHFGITVVEAMSAGCVPVISNLGGHKEILDFKSGFLWDSPAELEQITLSLAKSPKILKYLSIEAQKRSKIFSTACFQNSLASIIG